MEFKQEDWCPVSGFKESQDLGSTFYSGPISESEFAISLEGDIVVDDGLLHYGIHQIDLDVEKAQELYDELGQWLKSHGDS